MGSHMDAAKLDHIQLLGAQLISLHHHQHDLPSIANSDTCISLISDLDSPTTAHSVSLTAPSCTLADTGFDAVHRRMGAVA